MEFFTISYEHLKSTWGGSHTRGNRFDRQARIDARVDGGRRANRALDGHTFGIGPEAEIQGKFSNNYQACRGWATNRGQAKRGWWPPKAHFPLNLLELHFAASFPEIDTNSHALWRWTLKSRSFCSFLSSNSHYYVHWRLCPELKGWFSYGIGNKFGAWLSQCTTWRECTDVSHDDFGHTREVCDNMGFFDQNMLDCLIQGSSRAGCVWTSRYFNFMLIACNLLAKAWYEHAIYNSDSN